MKRIVTLVLLLFGAVISVLATPPHFEHIIIVVQENRTPDNLFGGSPSFELGVDIQRATGTPAPQPWCLGACFSPDHQHSSWKIMWNHGGTGWDNGSHACGIPIHNDCYADKDGNPRPQPTKCDGRQVTLPASQCSPKTWVSKEYDGGVVQPYYDIATRYGFANYFFQTNEGPSYIAHQFLFSGTSAPNGTPGQTDYQYFAADNPFNSTLAGCNGDPNALVRMTDAAGLEDNEQGSVAPVVPCFNHRSLPSLLDGNVSWKYYAQPGDTWATSIWTAPNSLQDICGHGATGQPCNSGDWNNKVVHTRGQILTDIGSCSLPQVSWVIPSGDASDHPGMPKLYINDSNQIEHGPAWVASIVNAVGNSWANSKVNNQNHQCDYWGGHTTGSKNQPTLILIVWDDWGGWWDHVDPATAPNLAVRLYDPNCNVWGCGDTYGFRVPFLVVSAFMAPSTGGVPPAQGYVSGLLPPDGPGEVAPYIHDFGSVLAFTEYNWQLGFGTGGINPQYPFADAFAPELQSSAIPLADFFCDGCAPQSFQAIPLPPGAWQTSNFLSDTDTSDPDDDALDND